MIGGQSRAYIMAVFTIGIKSDPARVSYELKWKGSAGSTLISYADIFYYSTNPSKIRGWDRKEERFTQQRLVNGEPFFLRSSPFLSSSNPAIKSSKRD
jgi:hypothetical protein